MAHIHVGCAVPKTEQQRGNISINRLELWVSLGQIELRVIRVHASWLISIKETNRVFLHDINSPDEDTKGKDGPTVEAGLDWNLRVLHWQDLVWLALGGILIDLDPLNFIVTLY